MRYDLQTFRGDVTGGVMAAVVSITAAATFGEVSGLGAVSGIYGAIAVGLFVGLFGRERPQMASTSSVMAVAMATVLATTADTAAEAFTVVILAGLLQMLFGAAKIGSYISYTPYSVIAGFTSGIGVMLVLSQIQAFLGGTIEVSTPVNTIRTWPDALSDLDTSSLIIAGVTLTVTFFWPHRLRQMVPAMLAGLTAGTLLSVIYLSDVATIDGVPTGLPQLQRPSTSVSFLASALVPALTIALLSSLRGLVSSLAVDSQTRTREDPDRGLLSLGVGNVAAGLSGGLPGHMTFATTMLNMRMGGKTRVSTLMRVLALLLMVFGFGHYLVFIPHAALAGVLFTIGWEMIDWRFLARIHRVQREHLLIMLTTLGVTLFVDLITAIAVGLIVSGMIGARQFERLQLDNIISVPLLDQIFLREEHPDEHGISPYSARVGLVKLRGSYTVASSSKLMRIIGDDIVGHQVVILDFSETNHIDDSAALVIEQLIDTAAASGTDCIVTGLSGAPAASLESLDVLRRVPADQIVETLDTAREKARQLLDRPVSG